MRLDTGLGAERINCIVALNNARAVLSGTTSPIGVLTNAFEGFDESTMTPIPDSCEVITSGVCSVKTSSCVAGDWFASDASGQAVKVETGFALGRILADPVDSVALCVITPVYLA